MLDNNVCDFPKHDETLLDHSYTFSFENTTNKADVSITLKSDTIAINANDKLNPASEKQCFSETLHYSVSSQTYVTDHQSKPLEVIVNDLHKSDENLFLYSNSFPETSEN